MALLKMFGMLESRNKGEKAMIIIKLVLTVVALLIGICGVYLTYKDWERDEEEQKFEEFIEDLMEMIKK